MSEPVIPERYKLQHSGFVGVLENGSEDGNGFVELLVIKLMGEVGIAEAKVAELEGAVDYLKNNQASWINHSKGFESKAAAQATMIAKLRELILELEPDADIDELLEVE